MPRIFVLRFTCIRRLRDLSNPYVRLSEAAAGSQASDSYPYESTYAYQLFIMAKEQAELRSKRTSREKPTYSIAKLDVILLYVEEASKGFTL